MYFVPFYTIKPTFGETNEGKCIVSEYANKATIYIFGAAPALSVLQ